MSLHIKGFLGIRQILSIQSDFKFNPAECIAYISGFLLLGRVSGNLISGTHPYSVFSSAEGGAGDLLPGRRYTGHPRPRHRHRCAHHDGRQPGTAIVF